MIPPTRMPIVDFLLSIERRWVFVFQSIIDNQQSAIMLQVVG